MRFSGGKMFLKESDGVPLKIKNNAQHHNTEPISIIWA